MYKTASNVEIGKYISLKIKEKYNGNASSFCKALLEIRNEDPTDKTSLALLKTRINKIIKGSQGLQLDDLCYFTDLFDITCEELLSAGKYQIINTNRYSNYAFAASTDEVYWDKYLKRADKIFHNTDEYGKTVVDYLFEFKNYKLLKYLIAKKYIWFVGDDEKLFGISFGAGTSIKRKPEKMISPLELELSDQDNLRTNMVSLAIENQDFHMLDNLHAKEIPQLHIAYCHGTCCYADGSLINQNYYNEEMVNKIAASSDGKMISYFSKSFEIDNEGKSEEFIFPYIGKMVDIMIKNNNRYTVCVLESIAKHNERQFEKLSRLITEAYNSYKNECFYFDKNEAYNYVTKYHFNFDEYGIFNYRYSNKSRMASNIVCVNERANDVSLNLLIDKINGYFYDIKSLNMNKLIIEGD